MPPRGCGFLDSGRNTNRGGHWLGPSFYGKNWNWNQCLLFWPPHKTYRNNDLSDIEQYYYPNRREIYSVDRECHFPYFHLGEWPVPLEKGNAHAFQIEDEKNTLPSFGNCYAVDPIVLFEFVKEQNLD